MKVQSCFDQTYHLEQDVLWFTRECRFKEEAKLSESELPTAIRGGVFIYKKQCHQYANSGCNSRGRPREINRAYFSSCKRFKLAPHNLKSIQINTIVERI